MTDPVRTYERMQISGLNQKELIVALYAGALRYIEQAKEKIRQKDVPGTHDRLDRARNIFLHLLSTLNLEQGGDLARKLSALYAYFVEKITVANVTKEIKELDDIVPLISELKEAWEKAEVSDQKGRSASKQHGERVGTFSAKV